MNVYDSINQIEEQLETYDSDGQLDSTVVRDLLQSIRKLVPNGNDLVFKESNGRTIIFKNYQSGFVEMSRPQFDFNTVMTGRKMEVNLKIYCDEYLIKEDKE